MCNLQFQITTTTIPATSNLPHLLEQQQQLNVSILRAESVGGNKENQYIQMLCSIWEKAFIRVFSPSCYRILPLRKSALLGFALRKGGAVPYSTDFLEPNDHRHHCFGSSSPNGDFSLFNFESIKKMGKAASKEVDNDNRGVDIGNNLSRMDASSHKLVWEDRDPLPVWRGQPYGFKEHVRVASTKKNLSQSATEFYHPLPTTYKSLQEGGTKYQRVPLIGFSIHYPTLVNAAASKVGRRKGNVSFLFNNELMSFPIDPIPPKVYYNEYQTHIVMGGHGAAFRTADHLAHGSAVILQEYPYKEWFTPYMTPFVEYIPLAYNISNLNETLYWDRLLLQCFKLVYLMQQLFMTHCVWLY